MADDEIIREVSDLPAPAPPAGIEAASLDEAAIERAQHIAGLHRQLRIAALTVTSARDWIDIDGQPYLSAAGCSRLSALFRIRQRGIQIERIAEPDGQLTIMVRGEASSALLDPDGWIEVIGAASSADPFLSRGGRVRPALGDIAKKAMTNWWGRAIRQLIGLGNLSWDELAKVGISRQNAERISFAKPETSDDDLIWVQIPFRDKDKLRDIVRKLAGHPPKWDGERKAWGIPRDIAEHPEIKSIVNTSHNATDSKAASAEFSGDQLFGGPNDR